MQSDRRPAAPLTPPGAPAEPEIWKSDWDAARVAWTDWWRGDGLAICITAPREEPIAHDSPAPTEDLWVRWTDPQYRLQAELHRLGRTWFGGAAFPVFDTNIGGPGSLGLFLGGEGEPADGTVWYYPCIHDPEVHPALRFSGEDPWFQRHVAVLKTASAHAAGRYLVGCPDLIENFDTLVQLRGAQESLLDLVERPGWVMDRIGEINRAYFACYEAMDPWLSDAWGGSAFSAFGLWGSGRTIKTQCDMSCAMSPAMFRRFVEPALTEQCAWADHALYHLDGTQALPQLDNLLAIEPLAAIEWTPQAGLPGGGSPQWYDLYRRILRAGKRVQAIGVKYDEVLPLIDAVGARGMLIVTGAPSEEAGRALLETTGWRT